MYEKINHFMQGNTYGNRFLRNIRKRIANLKHLYDNKQNLFLTESDLKCHLFRELTKIQDINPDRNSPLIFTELSERLGINNVATDMTIYLPNTLNLALENRSRNYITKHFNSTGVYVDFELKLIRANENFNIADFSSDINKLVRMYEENPDGIMLYGFMIIAIRNNIYPINFDDWIESQNRIIENRPIEIIII